MNVSKIFKSIQGEGPAVGRPAIFIRLAGCDLKCPLCDTDHLKNAKQMSVSEIVKKVISLNSANNFVVLTGGEPFYQSTAELLKHLVEFKFDVQIETNGTFLDDKARQILEYYGKKITIVCSPKTAKISRNLLPFITAYKYVIEAGKVSRKNGLPTKVLGEKCLPHAAAPPDTFDKSKVFIQPLHANLSKEVQYFNRDKEAENLKTAIEVCEKFGNTLSLQIQKIIGKE